MIKFCKQASNIPTEIVLQETKNNRNVSRIPFLISYKISAPNVSQIMKENWSIFRVNESLSKTFAGDPIIFFNRTRNLREIISGNTIINNNVKRTTKENMNGESRAFNGREKRCVADKSKPLHL